MALVTELEDGTAMAPLIAPDVAMRILLGGK